MARRSARSAPVMSLAVTALVLAVRSWTLSGAGGRLVTEPLARVFAGAPITRQASPRASLIVRHSEKVDKIIETLKELTLLEASELVKAIEDTFDVDASASGGAVMMAAPAAGGGGAEEEKPAEKTEFDLVLKEVPKDKKIAILKVVRSLTGLGLKDAKGMVDNPGKVLEAKPKDICEDGLKQLEEAGATKGLRAVAAEFVPAGGAAAAAEGQPSDAYAIGFGADFGCGVVDEGWWSGLGNDAVWLDDAYGQEVTTEQDLFLWDFCPSVDQAGWPTDAAGLEVLEVSAPAEKEPSSPPNPRNYKTAPCWHFSRGRCAMGERCRFAHGPGELRKPDSGKRRKSHVKAQEQDPSEDILTLCGAWGALTKRKPGVLEKTILLDVGSHQPLDKSLLLSYRPFVRHDEPPVEPGLPRSAVVGAAPEEAAQALHA